MPDAFDVSLVVPAHDEGATIGDSLTRWLTMFERAGLRAECVVVDDGSTDATPDALAALMPARPHLRVIRQPQAGHGAALVAGYRAARGAWIVQIDGDDEIGAEYFEALWARRTTEGLALGRRDPSTRPRVRRLVSAGAAAYVRMASGARLTDANVPFRLLPQPLLGEFLDTLPPGTFAPNLAMAIYAGLRGWRLHEVPVVELARVTTRQRFGGARLWRGVFRTLQQSCRFALRLRQRAPRA